MRHVLAFLRSEDGPTAFEYAVMASLIIVVCLASISALGITANIYWRINGEMIEAASNG